MPLLEVIQTSQICTPGGSSTARSPYPQKLPPWMLPNFPRGRHMPGWGSLRGAGGESGIHLEFTRKGPTVLRTGRKVTLHP
jgi:hypothetical protein